MPQKGGREGGRERAREGRGGKEGGKEGGGREGGGRNGRGRRVLSVSIFAGECGIVHKANCEDTKRLETAYIIPLTTVCYVVYSTSMHMHNFFRGVYPKHPFLHSILFLTKYIV